MKKYLNASERNVIGWGLRHEFSIGKIAEGLKRAKSMVIMKLKNVAILIFQKRCD